MVLHTRAVALMTILLATVALGCDGDDRRGSVLQDTDSNPYAVRSMADGRTWMTDNLNLAVPNSYCYGGRPAECLRFGRLYTWASAVEACTGLGTGWRLPTDDDWREMAKYYGGVREDSRSDGQAAYKALMTGGPSGFNAVMGGDRESGGDYARVDDHGLYWSASESDKDHAWFYNFGRGGGLLNRHRAGEKSMAVSVRCMKTP